MGADGYSVRWTGEVQPAYSQAYTFRTLSGDGVRLWVDSTLVTLAPDASAGVDDWSEHGPEWRSSAPITLTAGEKYDLVLEYFDSGGGADAHPLGPGPWGGRGLWWASFSQLDEPIPSSQLYPAATLVAVMMCRSPGSRADGSPCVESGCFARRPLRRPRGSSRSAAA